MCFWYFHWTRILAHYPAAFGATVTHAEYFMSGINFVYVIPSLSLSLSLLTFLSSQTDRVSFRLHRLPFFNNFPLWLSVSGTHTSPSPSPTDSTIYSSYTYQESAVVVFLGFIATAAAAAAVTAATSCFIIYDAWHRLLLRHLISHMSPSFV